MGKIYDGMMGLIAGDALGVPYEFKQRDQFTAEDMVGFGTHNQPAGTWSDDSSMAIATMVSMVKQGKQDPDDIMKRFDDWYKKGKYTAHGCCFDIGMTTLSAMMRYRQGISPTECGGRDIRGNGNGSLMRILPLLFLPHTKEDVFDLSRLTHGHEIACMGCFWYLQIAEEILKGKDKEEAVKVLNDCSKEYSRLQKIASYKREEIKSTGYVADTLEAALWCFLNTENYRDCVLKAVNLGDDTDTVSAVAGGLAGLYYGVGGEKGIPEKWIDQIAKKRKIKKLCTKMEDMFMNG